MSHILDAEQGCLLVAGYSTTVSVMKHLVRSILGMRASADEIMKHARN